MMALRDAQGKVRDQLRLSTYDWLMENCVRKETGDLLARMLASQVAGLGDMPRYLGLGTVQFGSIMSHYFPDVAINQFGHYGKRLDAGRGDEHDELRELFLSHSDVATPVDGWLADILIAGCMGGNHLWQDLGLWSRKDLTALIRSAFSPLADKNVHDMKWKKFFYKQLCAKEGIYTCRAPSCQVCEDYAECFGPE
ncbi:MAG: nitrogen fixation protein NifQ [Pseudomonadota bacterium]